MNNQQTINPQDLTLEQKLALLNSLPVTDDDSDGEVTHYVHVDLNDETGYALHLLGMGEQYINEHGFEDGGEHHIDIASAAWEVGAKWYTSGVGFLAEKPNSPNIDIEQVKKVVSETDVMVKFYRAIIPAGWGPLALDYAEAIYEIETDLDANGYEAIAEKLKPIMVEKVQNLKPGETWTAPEWVPDHTEYSIECREMTKAEVDALPEWQGY